MTDSTFRIKNGLVVNTSLLVANNGKVGVNTASPSTTLHVAANDGIIVPRGNTAERPAVGANGMIRYNTDSGAFEGFSAGAWNLITTDTANVVSIGLSYDDGSDTLSIAANNFQSAYLRSNFGNSTQNTVITNTQISVSNSTATANLDPSKLLIGTSVVNSTILASGANVLVNTTAIFIGNSSVNVVSNSSQLSLGSNVSITPILVAIGNSTANLLANSIIVKVANSTGIANLTPTQLIIGTSTVNSSALSADFEIISTSLSIGNSTVNIASNSSSSSIGANVLFDSVKLSVGNSTANLLANSILVKIANASGSANLTPTQLVIGGVSLNSTALAIGPNVWIDSTRLFVGNSTANQSSNSILISLANSTSQANLDPIKLVIGTSTVNSSAHVAGANVLLDTIKLSVGNSTQNTVVNSTGFFLNGAAYSPTAVGGANTQILFNDSMSSNGISAFTFNKATNVVALSNSLTIGANITHDTTKVLIGNSTANLLSNSILISLANSSGTANLQPTQLLIGVSTVNSTAILSNIGVISSLLTIGNSSVNVVSNSTQLTVGSNVVVNTSIVAIGNSTVILWANSSLLNVANSLGAANLQPTQLVIGTSTVNSSAYIAGANVFLDSTKLSVGNSTANLLTNSTFLRLTNSTATANLDPLKLVIGTTTVNGTVLAAGSNVIANTSAISIGNSTVNVTTNSSSITLGPCLITTMNTAFVVTTLPNTQIIDSFVLASYLSAKYTLTLKDNNSSNVQISDILVVQGSGQTGVTELNMISNISANLGVFTVTSNATHALLNFIMTSNNITFKGMKVYTG